MSAAFVTRFAPSPTGRLHLGHAFSALAAQAAARAAGGRLLLRIEDIDTTRSRPVFEAAIYQDLAWLGLVWETPVRRQSDHLADYVAALERLRSRGLVYRCFKTRREVLDDIARAQHGPGEGPDDRVYRGGALPPSEEARLIQAGRSYAWRLSLDRARDALGGFDRLTFVEAGEGPCGEHGVIPADPKRAGDVVLARKDLGVAYHLAVVIDDALQGVTDVIRGCDLHEAAHIQRLIQALLDLPTPTYRHHRLISDAAGERLAKRRGSTTLRALREGGACAADICAMLEFAEPT